MHILLTDLLTCPRCGPAFGLIVLADQIDNRRVRQGYLGCPNCRTEYAIHDSVADLRVDPAPTSTETLAEGSAERALRLAVLLGVMDQPGCVLVTGAAPKLALAVADQLPNANVAAGSADAPGEAVGRELSWILHGSALPFRDRSIRAVALLGDRAAALPEAARVLAPGGRLVLDAVPGGTGELLTSLGLTVLLEQEGVAVASHSAGR